MDYLLATAIGQILAEKSRGLCEIVLPRSLPREFLQEIRDAVNKSEHSNRIECIVYGENQNSGEKTEQEIIRYRTLELDNKEGDIILVANESVSEKLKSLEVFVSILNQGLPSGVIAKQSGLLHIKPLSLRVAELAILQVEVEVRIKDIARSIERVFKFLGKAYKSFENDLHSWVDSYWLHLNRFSQILPAALKWQLSLTSTPLNTGVASYMAAGLPCPDNKSEFCEHNDFKRYADVVKKNWKDRKTVEQSISRIENLEYEHPIRQLNWKTLPDIKLIHHPIYAITHVGYSDGNPDNWLSAWFSTSESAFFGDQAENSDSKLSISISSSNSTKIETSFDDQSSIYVLPRPKNELNQNNDLKVATIKIRCDGPNVQNLNLCNEYIQFPDSMEVVTLGTANASNSVEFDIEITRKNCSNSFLWPEKPLDLNIELEDYSKNSTPGYSQKHTIKLIIPNPARTTVFAVEEKNSKSVILTHEDTQLLPDLNLKKLEHDKSKDEDLNIEFSNPQKLILACVKFNKNEAVKWKNNGELKPDPDRDQTVELGYYQTAPMPYKPTLEVNGFELKLVVKMNEGDYITPIIAAINLKRPKPVDSKLLERDPRYEMEEFLAIKCIRDKEIYCDRFKRCFGSFLLSTNSNGLNCRILWNEDLGAYSDLDKNVPRKFPNIPEPELFEKFWCAFKALDLNGCVSKRDNCNSYLPSALDLCCVSTEKIINYLEAYCDILELLRTDKNLSAWLGYPFSAILYDFKFGKIKGILLSPLHPLRLAWHWSVQLESEKLAWNDRYKDTASSFLRFVNGDSLPLLGSSLNRRKNYLSTSLSAGPEEFFCSWSMLSSLEFYSDLKNQSKFKLLGLELPLGAPSGIDNGGVIAAVKDYLRIYPYTQQLGVEVAAKDDRSRFADTDAAIEIASAEIVMGLGKDLPGGIRIYDTASRQTSAPQAKQVLKKFERRGSTLEREQPNPTFEWTMNHNRQKVDLRFLEESPIDVRLERSEDSSMKFGTTGPGMPINRYVLWLEDQVAGSTFSFTVNTLSKKSFSYISIFKTAVSLFESLKINERQTRIESSLTLNEDFVTPNARWTIMGNRHLTPAALSTRLKDKNIKLVLWEWRPAFLFRSEQKKQITITSNNSYTVLAEITGSFLKRISSTLKKCLINELDILPEEILRTLGVRGVGLASLLTMGHTQSLGAIGFFMAFQVLKHWEASSNRNQIHCILPMDAVYPLVDALATISSEENHDKKRADLLLLKVGIEDNGNIIAIFHPVEIKARSNPRNNFPDVGNKELQNAEIQLKSTKEILDGLCTNINMNNNRNKEQKLQLINSAIATLIESAFALRLKEQNECSDIDLEITILEAASEGSLIIEATAGTLLWFQADAKFRNQYLERPASNDSSGQGQFLSSFSQAAQCSLGDEYTKAVTKVINSSMLNQSNKE